MNLIPKNLSQLRRIALAVLLASVAILETTSISAQEQGKTITSPFGVANPYMNTSDSSESGSDGDPFVDPETGEVGHIIRNPFGVANPEGVDTGIDIPDDAGEEVGGIITSPFGVPASDDIDTGVDVLDEDEEYLISLPDDEESDVEGAENVDEVDDETSDDAKEIEDESAETTTEKYVPVIDNPTRGSEFEDINFSLAGTSTYTVESETNDINNAPTLYVHAGENFTLTLVANQNLPTNIQPIFRNLNQFGTQNPFGAQQSGSNPPYCFVYHVPSAMYEGTYSASISCTFNGVQIERVLKIEIVYFSLKIDYSGNGTIDNDDVYDTNNPFGKLIHINNLDVDNDGIPDFADGFLCNGYINGTGNQPIAISNEPQNTDGASLRFEKIIIRTSKNIDPDDWKVCFSYNETDLDINVYQTTDYVDGHPVTFQTFEPRDKENKSNTTMRIWGKDGGQARSRNKINAASNPGDFIPSNEDFLLKKLNDIRDEPENCPYYEYILYIEAVKPLVDTAVSGETITVSLRKKDNTIVRFSDSIVATSYQVVFEGITNDEIAGGHVVYNPCGIIKWDEENGEEAKFHFDTIPSGIPCTTVNWSADNLTLVGGHTGKTVTVRAMGDVNSEFTLTIDIGRGNTMNPSIKGKILEETTVKLFVWVVTDTNGNNPAFQRSKIDSWLDDVNQIYKQVGIKFEIDTTDGFNYIPETSYQIIETRDEGRNLVAYPQDPQHPGCPRVKDGLEVFFVKKMTFARGLSIPRDGIIIPEMKSQLNDINYLTLAHELGHACGLHDIYHSKTRKTPPYTTYSINNDINVNSLWIKNDCTYEEIPINATMSVAGYYKNDLKHIKLLKRLMMFGYGANASGTLYERRDFSRGDVYGVDMNYISHDVKTGLEGMVRNPQHDR